MTNLNKLERTLEARLREIEDRLEIYNLIASHPPAADTGAREFTASIWAENAVFDRAGELSSPTGREAIAEALVSPAHQAAIRAGLGHFTGLPHIAINGDRADVTTYLQILVPDPTAEIIEVPGHGSSRGYRIHRASVSRWELVRTSCGWQIERRTLRLIGTEPARDLLRRAIEPDGGAAARR